MRNRVTSVALLLSIIGGVLIGGCTGQTAIKTLTAKSDIPSATPEKAISADFKEYYKEISKLLPLEESIIKTYTENSGANKKGETEFFNVMNLTVIPEYRDYIIKLESIHPKTKEIRELHELYLKGVNKQFVAFSQMGVLNYYTNIGQINQSLADGRADLRRADDTIMELLEKYDIK